MGKKMVDGYTYEKDKQANISSLQVCITMF